MSAVQPSVLELAVPRFAVFFLGLFKHVSRDYVTLPSTISFDVLSPTI
jgi:hypothetical protein